MEVPPKKYFRLYPGNEVRLKGAYFVTCTSVEKDGKGGITAIHCTYDPDTKSGTPGADSRKVKGTIHWVDAKTAVPVTIRDYGYLLIQDEEGNDIVNPDSIHEHIGYAEPSLADAKPGERFQFFRHGYYIADTKLTTDDKKVFNQIVDLKSSFKVK